MAFMGIGSSSYPKFVPELFLKGMPWGHSDTCFDDRRTSREKQAICVILMARTMTILTCCAKFHL